MLSLAARRLAPAVKDLGVVLVHKTVRVPKGDESVGGARAGQFGSHKGPERRALHAKPRNSHARGAFGQRRAVRHAEDPSERSYLRYRNVNRKTHEVCGAEVLVRWSKKNRDTI